jgi:hypothetical protein
MLDRPHAAELPFREWQPDRAGDQDFARAVPAGKWDFFTRKLRPLADDCAARVRERLFAGVARPFAYKGAGGWMRSIFKTVLSAPDWLLRGISQEAALTKAFGPRDPGRAFVVPPYGWRGPVYAAGWPDMLDLIRRGWLTGACDTFVLCAEWTCAVALYWDGTSFYFGRRKRLSLTGPDP